MFGLLFSCLKWACQKLGWVNYFKIVAGALAFFLGPWTGHLWVTCYEMKDTSWLLAICIFHALLYAATLVACLCTDSHKVVCIWALWNGLFLLYYWIHYFVVTQNDTEFQIMASTMRKFEGIYVPATVADVCLVILPACYRAILPCRTSTSRGKRMKRGGSSDDDETDCDVRRLKRGRHTTTVAMEQECFVASSSSG